MSLVLIAFLVVLLAIPMLKFFRRQSVLYKLNIPVLNKFPFVIELFYPIIHLGLASAEERFNVIGEYCKAFPDLLKIWFGHKMVILVSNPDRIQKILFSPKCLEKWNLFYALMERDHGLISASPKRKWKEHRKFFNFSFSLKIIESFLPTFRECSETLCSTLEKEVGKGEFDFLAYAKNVSFDILCATSLGTNTKQFQNVLCAYET